MPNYKEISINVELEPEIILGNALRELVAVNANQDVQTKTNETKVD